MRTAKTTIEKHNNLYLSTKSQQSTWQTIRNQSQLRAMTKASSRPRRHGEIAIEPVNEARCTINESKHPVKKVSASRLLRLFQEFIEFLFLLRRHLLWTSSQGSTDDVQGGVTCKLLLSEGLWIASNDPAMLGENDISNASEGNLH